jgi:hypothetical protein
MFIPRQSVLENQFTKYAAQTATGAAGVGGVVAYAGAVVHLVAAATNQDAIVTAFSTYALKPSDSDLNPFGFAMQKVKTGYHQVHPTGFYMPGDLGSSDVIAQPSYDANGTVNGTVATPLAVAHLGIWDTTHYVCEHTANVVTDGNHMKPGQSLYVACNNASKVTNVATAASGDTLDYENLLDTVVVAKVVVGASAGQCSANIANSTLYPIRIKLLV